MWRPGTTVAAMEASAPRALPHQREKGAVRNSRQEGRAMLWELAG